MTGETPSLAGKIALFGEPAAGLILRLRSACHVQVPWRFSLRARKRIKRGCRAGPWGESARHILRYCVYTAHIVL